MNEDVRCNLNAFSGFSDRPVDQTIRSLKPHLFAGGAGDKGFKLTDRTWYEIPQSELSQLASLSSLG